VRDASDSLIMTRVLRAGDSYQVPTRKGLILVTGNAGGLEITVDGQSIPPLGPRGAVRRNISLDPETLLTRDRQ
jgi:cytoskeleton protein RodZ